VRLALAGLSCLLVIADPKLLVMGGRESFYDLSWIMLTSIRPPGLLLIRLWLWMFNALVVVRFPNNRFR